MLPWPWLPGTPAPVSGITHGPESRAGPSTMHRDGATGPVLGYSSDCRCYYDDSLPVVANFKLNLNTEYRDVCHGPPASAMSPPLFQFLAARPMMDGTH